MNKFTMFLTLLSVQLIFAPTGAFNLDEVKPNGNRDLPTVDSMDLPRGVDEERGVTNEEGAIRVYEELSGIATQRRQLENLKKFLTKNLQGLQNFIKSESVELKAQACSNVDAREEIDKIHKKICQMTEKDFTVDIERMGEAKESLAKGGF